jgi:hypothetical protein
MFQQSVRYRVFLQRGGSLSEIEGTVLRVDGDLLMLDVEGVQTIFHLSGGSVAYLEVVDPRAEAARKRPQIAQPTRRLSI